MFPRVMRGALVLACGLALAGPAAAHPHVWVDNSVTVLFEGENVTGFALDWTFDEVFSEHLVTEFDTDKNRQFSKAEMRNLEKNAFSNLKEYGYFAHVRSGNAENAVRQVTEFTADIDARKRVSYHFRIVLATPVQPAKAPLKAGFYDEEYFVDIGFLPKQQPRLAGAPAGCAAKIAGDTERPIYFGTVVPDILVVTCAAH